MVVGEGVDTPATMSWVPVHSCFSVSWCRLPVSGVSLVLIY